MSATNDKNTNIQDRMLGSVPGAPAVGRGPATDGAYSRHEYHHPAAGWGAARSVGHVLESRGNGVKHVTWELTRKQAGREFFTAHTVSELAEWSDYDLEDAGRLAEPMRYDAASDRYVPVSWDDAFTLVGGALHGLESPHEITPSPSREKG